MFAAGASGYAQSKIPPELERFSFLLGDWEGDGSGAPGQGSGTTTFSRGLQDRVMIRTSYAQYPASSNTAPLRHDDLMVVYVEQGNVRADYYDNEGHVIRYLVTSTSAGEALFVSDAASGMPRYRLGYRLAADGKLAGRFEIAPPGKPGDFASYLAWEMRRRTRGR
jgi:hypothetical protein